MYKVILILIFTWSNLFGQVKDFYGTWLSEKNELIFKANANVQKEVTLLNKDGQKICFHENIIYNNNLYLINYINNAKEDETYIFGYEKKGDSLLILKPGNSASRNFFQTFSPIVFKRQEYIIDKTLKFEKLILDKFNYRYDNNSYKLIISDNRQYKLKIYVQEYKQKHDNNEIINEIKGLLINSSLVKKDSIQYSGFLDERVFNELLFILATSQIKTTKTQGEMVSDAPKNYLEIYQNNEYHLYDYYFPPKNFQRLISFLESIKEKIINN